MNRIFAAVLVVLMVAGSAYAVDMETTGSYYVRGSYISNDTGLGKDDVADYTYYDSELDMTVTFKVSDYTKIVSNLEVRDMEWIKSQQDDRKINDPDPETPNTDEFRDNIDVARLYSSHAFSTGTIVDLGLMDGKAWAFSFGDTVDGYWRLKVLQKMDFGYLGAVFEKNKEEGFSNPTTEDKEKDDGDSYYFFGIFPAGTHKIMPLLIYANRSDKVPTGDEDGVKIMGIDLGIGGAFGSSLFYETEFAYLNYNMDFTGGEDYAIMGAYVNVWTMMGSTKVGGQVAYGSWDEDAQDGYGFGEDYTPTLFGADWQPIGTQDTLLFSEYSAVTLINLYAEFALSEALTLKGNGTYWMSNETETVWEDANGYEIDLGGDYKITDNVTYGVMAAYGQITQDEDKGGVEADPFIRMYHKFTINF